MPPFIHCAHEVPQPPLETPAQFKVASTIDEHLPSAGTPTCCITSAGAEGTDELDEELFPDPMEIERMSFGGVADAGEPEIKMVPVTELLKVKEKLVMPTACQ